MSEALKTQWVAGQSGNPGGRPTKITQLQRLIDRHSLETLERAFIESRTDNNVLSALLNLLAAIEQNATQTAARAQQEAAASQATLN